MNNADLIQSLIAQAEDAENQIQGAETQNERERWQRIAADWWQQVTDAEAN